MDPVLADGLPPTRSPGPLAAMPSGAAWGLIVSLPLLLGIFGVWLQADAESRVWTGRVLTVLDGDTVRVSEGLFTRTLRLADIDCPERLQPFGERAQDFLRELVRGQPVLVRSQGLDKYGRVVAELELADGRKVAEELLGAGMAWFNHRYSHRRELASLEDSARRQRRGLWRQRHPQPPWQWRHENR